MIGRARKEQRFSFCENSFCENSKRAGILIAVSLLASPLAATQVRIFRTQSQAAFAAGTLSGVSLDSLGRIELAPRGERLAAIAEPFLFAAAASERGERGGDGYVVGTGNSGKVLTVDGKGKVSELFAAPEPEVFAVWVDPDGTVFAGTSPHGKVYRIPAGGKGEVYYEPKETYIWALARAKDGALLVATGTQGKLFRVTGKGEGKVFYDSDDTHLRSLDVLPDGDVLLGTAGDGLILRLGPDGHARTLYDARQPEVVAITTAPDGTCYAAVVASEASLTETAKVAAASGGAGGAKKGAKGGGGAAGTGEPTVTVTVEGEGEPAAAPAPGPAAGRKESGPRSEILRISPSGVVERVWTFNDDTVYSLLWQGGALWVGTGLEGKLYRYEDGQMLLAKDVDERQIVALVAGGVGSAGPAFATTNGGALYRITAGREPKGTYTSAALDAGQVARFGSFRYRGDVPEGSSVKLSFRSGVSAEPDKTWSPWTAPKEGEEIAIADLPRGRYVEWRAELTGSRQGSPRIYSAELSYRQENLSPRIDALAVLEPGQILVPASFNPGNQVFEPAHPNREGIFTTLESVPDESGRVKPLWKRGYRALRWAASDPNEDKLTYSISFRPAERQGESGWLKVADDIDEDHYNFDATVLPDGIYRFRLLASDKKSNDPAEVKTAEQVSEPVVIDQTPPALLSAEVGDDKILHVRVKDALSPIREAVASLDAQEWKPVQVADGLLDGKAETLLLTPAPKGGLLLLRVTDAAYNTVTFDLSNRH